MISRRERQYAPEQIARFDQLRERRAQCRPKSCRGGENCWVEQGPRAWTGRNNGSCAGCGGVPRGLEVTSFLKYPG